MEFKKVALFGAGAVGSFFYWNIRKDPEVELYLIAEGERKERLEREGLWINGEQYFPLVKTPEEGRGADLLIVATKQAALEENLETIKTLVGEKTLVISPLNGVTSEELIASVVGEEPVIYSVIRVSSARKGNQIHFPPEKEKTRFSIGEKGKTIASERVIALQEFLDRHNIQTQIKEDILQDEWAKYASNIAQNLPQALFQVGYGAYSDSQHIAFIAKKLWREVVAVAAAKGITLQPELTLFGHLSETTRFSTLQDIDAGRHTEIDMFAGEMVKMGAELAIPVPYNEFIYHAIKAVEEKNDGKFNY